MPCPAYSYVNGPDLILFSVFLPAFGVSLLTIWLTFLTSQKPLFLASFIVTVEKGGKILVGWPSG